VPRGGGESARALVTHHLSLVTALSVEPLGHGAIRGNILLPSTRSARAAAAKLPETAQLRVFDVDMELANLAASLKAGSADPRSWGPRSFFRKSRRPHRRRSALPHLPYADCFAAALAQVAPTFRSARAELKVSAY